MVPRLHQSAAGSASERPHNSETKRHRTLYNVHCTCNYTDAYSMEYALCNNSVHDHITHLENILIHMSKMIDVHALYTH